MEPLFPEVPEDLTTADANQLASWPTQIQETLLALAAGEREIPEGMTQAQVFEASAAASADAQRIAAFVAETAEAEGEGRQLLLTLAADAGASVEAEASDVVAADDTDDTTDTDTTADDATADDATADDDEGDANSPTPAAEASADEETDEAEAPAAVAASAAPRIRAALPAPSRRHQPVISVRERDSRAVLVASAGIPGVTGGRELDRLGLGEAILETYKRTRSMPGAPPTIVASAEFPIDESRTLHEGDTYANAEKIRAIVPLWTQDREALVASGGLCAPLTPFYDLPNFASRARPVRDALAGFRAARGGVTVPTPGIIGDITDAITIITEAQDAEGGSAATKSCQAVDCPTFTDVAVTAIAHCREYGNLGSRAWPEQVAFENDLTMAAHSRAAEQYLLDRLKALSINVTTAKVYNALHDLIYAVTRAAAGIRYRLRMLPEQRFRLLAPSWLLDLLLADTAGTQFDRFRTRGELEAALERAGVTVSWYIDTPTSGTTQGFANETASALDDFPDVAQMALYPEGAFLHLDGGTLELGIVRDSTLNATNDFQVFGETWEEVARIAPAQAALWITATICPDGTFPALQTALTC